MLLEEPLLVLGVGFEDARGDRVPDALVRDYLRLLDLHLAQVAALGDRRHVVVRQIEQQRLDVLRRAAQPVLERHHERARVLGLVTRKVLEHLGERADEFEHRILEGSALGLVLLHEVRHDALGLAHRRHRERANLVELHHVRHRREDNDSVEPLALGLDRSDHLVRQLLHKDERANEDVGVGDVLLELRVVGVVAELLEDVARALDRHVGLAGVDALARRRQRRLVLRLEHDVDHLEHLAVSDILRHDLAVVRVGLGEEAGAAGAGRDHRGLRHADGPLRRNIGVLERRRGGRAVNSGTAVRRLRRE
mmetsp:Transcript_62047/g.164611  ORF Transcript_62047/g.164611 Transcript_62047/m.164611 type:complete len:308 (+) Transcript_62047:1128-2051(+)